MSADRRRWERFVVPAKVLVEPKRGEPFEARVRDVSAGGAMVISSAPQMAFRAGVRITFYPGGGERALEIEAEVVHASEEGFGVEFMTTTPESVREQLVDWAKNLVQAKAETPSTSVSIPAPDPVVRQDHQTRTKDETRAPRILLVQDDAELSKLLARAIQHMGAQVSTVNDAAEAIRKLTAEQFDVILCDWVPLDRDPEEFMRALRSSARATPIVVVSALANSVPFRTRAHRLGATDLITKPFKLTALVKTLNKILLKRMESATPSGPIES